MWRGLCPVWLTVFQSTARDLGRVRSRPFDNESHANELRERVEAARSAVRVGSSVDSRHGRRLDAALSELDRYQRRCQDRLGDQRDRLQVLQHQNTRLKGILHALLLALEDGRSGRDLVEAVRRANTELSAFPESKRSASGKRGALRQVLRRMNRLADADDPPPEP